MTSCNLFLFCLFGSVFFVFFKSFTLTSIDQMLLAQLFVLGLAAGVRSSSSSRDALADANGVNGNSSVGSPVCNILHKTGLHADDDLEHKDHTNNAAACCLFCSETQGCVAWTLSDSKCRAKGPKALNNKTQVQCSACTSGFLHLPPSPSPPTPSPSPPPPPPPGPPAPRPAGQKNVLFVVVDDLRPQLGCYHQNQTLTPNVDALAATSLVFDRAYCQLAVCSPSRNSFLSGRRPDTTKVWNFKVNFRAPAVGANWSSMPQWFKEHGYWTAGTGKVYHPAEPPNNDPPSWSQPYNNKGQDNPSCPPCPAGATWCGNSWCSLDRNSTRYKYSNNDEWIAADGAGLLALAAATPGTPFFVAVGLHKPHTPYAYPSEIDHLYPPVAEMDLPTALARSTPTDMPEVAWIACSAINGYNLTSPMPDFLAQQHRRAYYAAVTHTDQLIGTLLAQLSALGLEQSTAVVVTGDHGYVCSS
jgi:iduronate 2-sulfatase